MFTWKRFAVVLGLLAVGILATRLADAPRVAAAVAALVRNVDEPARVPYFVSEQPTCPFTNECEISGPVVPAGMRARITRLEGTFIGSTADAVVALGLNDDSHPVLMFPVTPFGGAFYGDVESFSQEVDFDFEAGQTPVLVVGCAYPNTIPVDTRNTLTIVGYEVSLTP
jgi:hypothetical protein